ncbi:MAG: DUF2179 domain-containing protein [Gemmatimonadota bacterium]
MAELFASPLGPLIIFLLRIVDVSLATVRMLLIIRGQRMIVPILGFFEAAIWVVAVGVAIQNLHSFLHIFGYAAGFGAGSVVGLWLEGKLAMGLATLRIISRDDGEEVASNLRTRGFGVTELAGYGRSGKVEILLSIVKRRQVKEVVKAVEAVDPDAFISVEEPRAIRRGWMFPQRRK